MPKVKVLVVKGFKLPETSIELTLKSRIYALPHVLLGAPKLAELFKKGLIELLETSIELILISRK